MAHSQSLEEWARTAEVSRPPQWGELEDALLSRAERPRNGVGYVLALLLIVLLVVLLYGSPLIGLAVVVINAVTDDPVSWFWATIPFVAANSLPLSTLGSWWGTRRRQGQDLAVAGGTSAVSLLAYLILRAAPETDGIGWVALLTLLATASGLVVFVILLVKSKPGRRRRVPPVVRALTVISPPNELHYLEARERGLKILLDRGQIDLDEDRLEQVTRTPLGRWHTLDTAEQG